LPCGTELPSWLKRTSSISTRQKDRTWSRRNFYRPRDAAIAAKYKSQFPSLALFTVDERFGGWTKAQNTSFADSGVFDQVQQGGK